MSAPVLVWALDSASAMVLVWAKGSAWALVSPSGRASQSRQGLGLGLGSVWQREAGHPVGSLMVVPLLPPPDESPTAVPDPSFMPQRPSSPVAAGSSVSLVA